MTAELHQFPNTLAQRLRERVARNADFISRTEAMRQEWIENFVGLALDLAAARLEHPSDPAFGAWLRMEQIEITANDRSALIELAKDEVNLRKALATVKIGSHPDTIWRKQKSTMGFSHSRKSTSSKPTKAPKQPYTPTLGVGTLTAEVREWALKQFADGKAANEKDADEVFGLKTRNNSVQIGIAEAKGIWAGRTAAGQQAPIDISGLSATAQQKIDHAVATYKKQLDAEYATRRTA